MGAIYRLWAIAQEGQTQERLPCLGTNRRFASRNTFSITFLLSETDFTGIFHFLDASLSHTLVVYNSTTHLRKLKEG
jgi:hypothetical protein